MWGVKGGLGKTTLAATLVRNEDVRAAYSRICFVSVGQEPAMVELQRTMYVQCTGVAMEIKSSATIASQREVLGKVAVDKRWLCVLDDVS